MGGTVSKLVFQPPEPTYVKDDNLIWLQTSTNDVIPAFFIDRRAKYTIMFSHGNAEDLGVIVHHFQGIAADLGVNIFAYEYPGYGLSTGEPTEHGVYAASESAYKYLRDVVGIPWKYIVLYGRSLGSGPSCHIASKTAVRGIILQSPLASVFRVGFDFRFTLPGDLFANIDKVSKIKCPIFIVHGTKDEIVPVWHGKQLHERCKYPHDPLWIEEAQHNNIETVARKQLVDKMREFIKSLDTSAISGELARLSTESSGI